MTVHLTAGAQTKIGDARRPCWRRSCCAAWRNSPGRTRHAEFADFCASIRWLSHYEPSSPRSACRPSYALGKPAPGQRRQPPKGCSVPFEPGSHLEQLRAGEGKATAPVYNAATETFFRRNRNMIRRIKSVSRVLNGVSAVAHARRFSEPAISKGLPGGSRGRPASMK